jgi:hypothetical protein
LRRDVELASIILLREDEMSDPDTTEVTGERAVFDLQFAIVRFKKAQILRLAWQAGRVLVYSTSIGLSRKMPPISLPATVSAVANPKLDETNTKFSKADRYCGYAQCISVASGTQTKTGEKSIHM